MSTFRWRALSYFNVIKKHCNLQKKIASLQQEQSLRSHKEPAFACVIEVYSSPAEINTFCVS